MACTTTLEKEEEEEEEGGREGGGGGSRQACRCKMYTACTPCAKGGSSGGLASYM
jgi:hypothetical protein